MCRVHLTIASYGYANEVCTSFAIMVMRIMMLKFSKKMLSLNFWKRWAVAATLVTIVVNTLLAWMLQMPPLGKSFVWHVLDNVDIFGADIGHFSKFAILVKLMIWWSWLVFGIHMLTWGELSV